MTAPVTASFLHKPCKCVKHHSPKVNRTQLHHIWPLGRGGPDTKDNLVPLCPTTHSEVHLIMERFDRQKGPTGRRREESEYAYALALSGWQQAYNAEHA